jgi:hypothetical protein
MIRIDEIYYNTFLPKIQENPYGVMHWFDPFGSVDLADLCARPAVNHAHDTVRYLFWDQEPLHTTTVDQTLPAFVKEFPLGQRHLITSERNSEFVEHACNTYGFVPHYYFFHGWAALDWFRGYNRSFLIPPPDQRQITRTFISPNRIIGGTRRHRLVLLYHMIRNGMMNNWISCPAECPAEHTPVADLANTLTDAYTDAPEVFAQQKFPISFPGESGAPMHSNQLSLFAESADSLLYLVTETVANGRRLHLTEKTFKPICLRMPFIIAGTRGSLAYLRSYGFRTFGDLWDESYDDEVHDDQRMEKIAWVLQGLDGASVKEKQRLFDLAQEICEYNYNHFYSGGFEQILWNELTGMLDEF